MTYQEFTKLHHALGLRAALGHAVTRWDRMQQNKRGYNIYALAIYLRGADDVAELVASDGLSLGVALGSVFNGAMLRYLQRVTECEVYESGSVVRHNVTNERA
jgi:hypothetical protein